MSLTIPFEHSFAERLGGLFAEQQPTPVERPTLLAFNRPLAARLGVPSDAPDDELARTFSGNALPDGARPIAQAYAGHQFGGYNPQLGDGRAVLLGEAIDADGSRFDIALKGSGRTPFSRGGDGRASVGPVLREFLMGEAMHALGVPTTRALAAVATGEMVRRQQPEPGAVLTRVAASHLRVGTFQFAAASGDRALLTRLTDVALERHGPDLGAASDSERALALLDAVLHRQASLIAEWMLLGFIHGVMNTDNMTISGETIDYGPCAFMEAYDPGTVFSSIDHGGRYRYENQPTIGLWNLTRLAEALLPLVDDDTELAVATVTEVLETYQAAFEAEWLRIARVKLGAPDADRELADDLFDVMHAHATDFTLTWRALTNLAADDASAWNDLFPVGAADSWVARWSAVADRSPESIAAMRGHNPVYIPRNHLVEEALVAAIDGDLEPFERLLAVVTDPFEERLADTRFSHPAPPGFTDSYVTYCGT